MRLTTAGSATDVAIKKNCGSGTTALIISNKETEDIMEIVKALEESESLIEDIRKAIKMEVKEEKEGFLGMLLGTLTTITMNYNY